MITRTRQGIIRQIVHAAERRAVHAERTADDALIAAGLNHAGNRSVGVDNRADGTGRVVHGFGETDECAGNCDRHVRLHPVAAALVDREHGEIGALFAGNHLRRQWIHVRVSDNFLLHVRELRQLLFQFGVAGDDGGQLHVFRYDAVILRLPVRTQAHHVEVIRNALHDAGEPRLHRGDGRRNGVFRQRQQGRILVHRAGQRHDANNAQQYHADRPHQNRAQNRMPLFLLAALFLVCCAGLLPVAAVDLRVAARFGCFFRRRLLFRRVLSFQIVLHVKLHGWTCRTATAVNALIILLAVGAVQPNHADARGIVALRRRRVVLLRRQVGHFVFLRLVTRGKSRCHAVQIVIKIETVAAGRGFTAIFAVLLIRHDESITSVPSKNRGIRSSVQLRHASLLGEQRKILDDVAQPQHRAVAGSFARMTCMFNSLAMY